MKINNDNDDVQLKAENYRTTEKSNFKGEHFTDTDELHQVAKKKMSYADREIQRVRYSVYSKTGQENIEMSLLIHFIQMIYTAIILYIYLEILARTFIYLYLISGFVDIVLMSFFIYFLAQFRSHEAFSHIPRGLFTASDYINFTNLIFKTFNVSLLFSYAEKLNVRFYFAFGFKYLLDVYFCLLSLKLFMFCPCSVWLNNKLFACFRWIKFGLFCCQDEERHLEDEDGKKNEVLESNY
jgi:hypothetical protein